jgi:hypothetical protein
MKTNDFNKPVTGTKLAENLEKQFGARVNLEKYDREQLEDFRNKLRTRIFQQEGSAKFNDLLTNETYQKDKAMLELLNTRIKEMLGEQMQKLRDRMDQLSEGKKGLKQKIHPKGAKPDFLDMDKDGDKKEPMKKAVADKKAGPKKGVNPFAKVKEGAKPDFLDMDKDGDEKEPMKKAIKDKKANEGFPTVADAKARHEKEKTTGKFDKKQTSTGTVYTKKHTKADAEHTPEKKVKEGSIHAKDCNCKECMMQEGFPTVDDAKKAAAGTTGMKAGEKKKSSTGGEITKTATGLKHTAGKNYGGKDAPKAPDSDKKAGKSVKESQFKHNVKFVNESIGFLLQEDEEGKAKTITAAGDMVNDFTSWMQRVGQYQTKAIIELSDQIRAEFGQAEAEQFKQAVGPALSAALETLTAQREAISNAVATLAGEAPPEQPMGMEPGMDAGAPDMAPTEPDMMNPGAGDEFGASDAAAGGDMTSGREMREGRQERRARKLAESHSLMAKLSR